MIWNAIYLDTKWVSLPFIRLNTSLNEVEMSMHTTTYYTYSKRKAQTYHISIQMALPRFDRVS